MALRHLDARVAQENRDALKRHALKQKLDRERVAESVRVSVRDLAALVFEMFSRACGCSLQSSVNGNAIYRQLSVKTMNVELSGRVPGFVFRQKNDAA
jgi:hypothetical protein